MSERVEDRGRDAERPAQIPGTGWRDVLARTKAEIGRDRISMVAGSMAFFGVLAIFPALAALVSIYGLFSDPADVQGQVASFASMLPASARELLESQMTELAAKSSSNLGWGLVISVLGALWSASAGMKAFIETLNIAYDEEEERGFFKLRGLALLLTLGTLVFVVGALALAAGLPTMLESMGIGPSGQRIVEYARWPALALIMMFWLAVLYRVAPCRDQPRWQWVSWGAVLSTLLWLGATGLFSFYVSRFGSYDETYGTLGGGIVFLLWLYLSAFIVLLGAELNSELEHQTAVDSTTGDPKPMGQRDAAKADSVGPPADAVES